MVIYLMTTYRHLSDMRQ